MDAITTRTFRSGDDEIVRLPPEVAYGEGVELTVIRSGDVITLSPKRDRPTMKEMLAELAKLPRPTSVEVRDLEDIPERPGL